MNINKGLKQKNKLAKDIQNKWNLILTHNSGRKDAKKSYNTKQLFTELIAGVDALVETKTAIAKANIAIYDKIFRLAELKGIVMNMKSISVTEGPQTQFRGYGKDDKEIEFEAQMDHTFIDSKVAEFEKEIETIQDELDKFNFTTDI